MRENVLVWQSKMDRLINNKDIKDVVMQDFERVGITNNESRFQPFDLKADWVPVGDYPYPNLPELVYTVVMPKKKIN